MKKILNLILLFILFTSLNSSFFITSADENVNIDITMIGGTKLDDEGTSKIVAGIWHYINFTLINQYDELTLKIYKGETIPTGEKNESNYYEFQYNKNNIEKWIDISNYTVDYINTEKCSNSNTIYSFCIGIKDELPSEEFSTQDWKIKLLSSSTDLHSSDFILEKPTIGMAKPHGDKIIFNIDPFTEMEANANDYFRFLNRGNTPIIINFNYKDYEEIIEVTGEGNIFSPDEGSNHYLSMSSESWQPSELSTEIYGNGQIPEEYMLSSDAFLQLPQAPEFVIPIEIIVGHGGFLLEIINGGISFQYKKNVKMEEGETKDLDIYISGDGVVDLNIWSDETKNISILDIKKDGSSVDFPTSITSTSSSEQKYTVKVKALREGKKGIINYQLKVDGKTKNYQTEITIEAPNQPTGEETDLNANNSMMIIVAISLVLVVLYMIFSHLKYKRR